MYQHNTSLQHTLQSPITLILDALNCLYVQVDQAWYMNLYNNSLALALLYTAIAISCHYCRMLLLHAAAISYWSS